METNKNNSQLKKLGKIEGVIYVEDANVTTTANNPQPKQQQSKLPFPDAGLVKEPTKGVQTYIPMSMYRRLNNIKLTRGENISDLVMQAIGLWLDVQEGSKNIINSNQQ